MDEGQEGGILILALLLTLLPSDEADGRENGGDEGQGVARLANQPDDVDEGLENGVDEGQGGARLNNQPDDVVDDDLENGVDEDQDGAPVQLNLLDDEVGDDLENGEDEGHVANCTTKVQWPFGYKPMV